MSVEHTSEGSGRKGLSGVLCLSVVALATLLVLQGIVRAPVGLEEAHLYAYGVRVLSAGAFGDRLTDGQLPVAALYALPGWLLGGENSGAMGRFLSLAGYVLLCAVVWRWAMLLYGARGAAAAVTLTAFFPALIVQGGMMTPEIGAVAASTGALYAFWRCLWDPTFLRAVRTGVWIGVALLAKYVTVVLLPISVILVIWRAVSRERMESRGRVLHGSIMAALIAWCTAVVIVDVGFMFQRVGTTIAWLDCQSRLFQFLRAGLGTLILPLPREYLVGLDRILAPRALATGLPYLVGESAAQRVGPAFLWAILLLLGVLAVIRGWRWERRYSDGVLIAPLLWMGLSLGVLSHPQVAVRFVLLFVPLLALLGAGLWARGGSTGVQKAAGWLVVLQVAAVTVLFLMLGD